MTPSEDAPPASDPPPAENVSLSRALGRLFGMGGSSPPPREAIESGRQVPSTVLSLGLARALGCSVEDLFRIPLPDGIDSERRRGIRRESSALHSDQAGVG